MNPQIKKLREIVSLRIAEGSLDLTTNVRIDELSDKDKSRALYNANKTVIFAKQINDALVAKLKEYELNFMPIYDSQ